MQFTHLKPGAPESGQNFLSQLLQGWGWRRGIAGRTQTQLQESSPKSWLCRHSLTECRAAPPHLSLNFLICVKDTENILTSWGPVTTRGRR